MHLNTPEKRRRYSNLRLRLENKEKQLERMRDKIDHLMKMSEVIVGQQLSNDLKSTMADMAEDVRKTTHLILSNDFSGSSSWQLSMRVMCGRSDGPQLLLSGVFT